MNEGQRKAFSAAFNNVHNATSNLGGHAYNLLHNEKRSVLIEECIENLKKLGQIGDEFHSGSEAAPVSTAEPPGKADDVGGKADGVFNRDAAIATLKAAGKNVDGRTSDQKLQALLDQQKVTDSE